MSQIWIEIAAILFFAILGYIISRKMKLPASIGLIIVGILVGPSVLNLTSFVDIESIAQIGGIILLFLVGLETNFREIYTAKAMKVAAAGVAAPFVLGYIVSVLLGFTSPVAFIIASALTATSIGITVAVLKEMGKINTEAAKLIIGAAVIDDVLGLLVLSATSTGFAPVPLAIMAVKAVAFIAVTIILSAKVVPKLVDKFDFRFGIENPKLTFMFGMLIAFGYSFLAEAIGLSAIVGAFMAGVSLSRSRNVNFFYSGSEFLEAIFTSIFFVSLGVIVELNAAFSVLYLIIILTIIGIISKFAACGYAARKSGFAINEALIVGAGMVPRGEVAMIIGLYGFTMGIINQDIYSAIIFMSFLTTLIAPFMLKILYGTKKLKRFANKKPFK